MEGVGWSVEGRGPGPLIRRGRSTAPIGGGGIRRRMPRSDASGIGAFLGATDPIPRPRSLGTARTRLILVFIYIVVGSFSQFRDSIRPRWLRSRRIAPSPHRPACQSGSLGFVCSASRRLDTLPIRQVASFDHFRRGGSPPLRIGPLTHQPPRSTPDPPGDSIDRIVKEPHGDNPPV